MAHFAELDANNIVIRVIVVHNNDAPNEARGLEFLASLYGAEGKWVQCSYNANIRKNFAGIGYTYDPNRDAFIPQKPHASWILDEKKCQWEPPVPIPSNNKRYVWDEPTLAWIEQ